MPVGRKNPGAGAGEHRIVRKYSREYLRSIGKYEVVKIYRSMFNDSPHCHSDEPELWESIYDAILTGTPQKIDPRWD